MSTSLTSLAIAASAVVALVGCSSGTTSEAPSATSAAPTAAPSSPSAPSATTSVASGGWITWDQYQKDPQKYANSDVVLFFNASWCPTCQNTVKSLDAAKAEFPAGLTVVSIDYDTATDLKKKYGVTTQHTFVHVDSSGAELKKWTGTETVDDIQAKV